MLRGLTGNGELIRIGYDVYACAESSSVVGRPMSAVCGGFTGPAREALTKLEVLGENVWSLTRNYAAVWFSLSANSASDRSLAYRVRVTAYFSRSVVPGHGESLVLLQSKRIVPGEAGQLFQRVGRITI